VGVWRPSRVGLCIRDDELRTGLGILDGEERRGLGGRRSNIHGIFATWAGVSLSVLDLALCWGVEGRRTIGGTAYATSSSEIPFD
jgi:hypothetical protein